MAVFPELKTRISMLGRAEYRYDHLVAGAQNNHLVILGVKTA